MEEKHCSKCRVLKPLSEFGFKNGTTEKLRAVCKKCSAVETERWKLKNKSKPRNIEYHFDIELVEWLKKYARMPNNTSTRTIMAYSCAGWQDDILVIGREVERVVNPLFGNPMI
jgi:hypothetical protein